MSRNRFGYFPSKQEKVEISSSTHFLPPIVVYLPIYETMKASRGKLSFSLSSVLGVEISKSFKLTPSWATRILSSFTPRDIKNFFNPEEMVINRTWLFMTTLTRGFKALVCTSQ